MDQLEREQAKTGLHHIEKLDEIYSNLSQKGLDAYQLAQQLNTMKNPGIIKKINNEFLQEGQVYLKRIS